MNVAGALSIDGVSQTGPITGITAISIPLKTGAVTGNSGDITINAGSLSVNSNGQITTDTFGTGKGGNIAVTVAGALSIDGTSSTVLTGITALTDGTGSAGNITVGAGTLNIVTNGLISVDSLGGTGNAGSVTVNVAGALSIDGRGQNLSTGISSESGFSPGNAGEVRVTAGSLALTNGGQISASTFGAGAGGDVQVAAGVLGLSNGGLISASTYAAGAGGNVQVTGNSLAITQDGSISASTFGNGAGGNVNVAIAGSLSIDGTAQNFGTGITSASGTGGGNAGAVTVSAGSLAIANGGEVSASTLGQGAGGDIMVNLAGDLVIDGIANPSAAAPAGIIARTLDPNGGNAGHITVNAGNISILDSGVISTSTFGAGAAGEVSVNASGKLVIDGAGTRASARTSHPAPISVPGTQAG